MATEYTNRKTLTRKTKFCFSHEKCSIWNKRTKITIDTDFDVVFLLLLLVCFCLCSLVTVALFFFTLCDLLIHFWCEEIHFPYYPDLNDTQQNKCECKSKTKWKKTANLQEFDCGECCSSLAHDAIRCAEMQQRNFKWQNTKKFAQDDLSQKIN